MYNDFGSFSHFALRAPSEFCNVNFQLEIWSEFPILILFAIFPRSDSGFLFSYTKLYSPPKTIII